MRKQIDVCIAKDKKLSIFSRNWVEEFRKCISIRNISSAESGVFIYDLKAESENRNYVKACGV